MSQMAYVWVSASCSVSISPFVFADICIKGHKQFVILAFVCIRIGFWFTIVCSVGICTVYHGAGGGVSNNQFTLSLLIRLCQPTTKNTQTFKSDWLFDLALPLPLFAYEICLRCNSICYNNLSSCKQIGRKMSVLKFLLLLLLFNIYLNVNNK